MVYSSASTWLRSPRLRTALRYALAVVSVLLAVIAARAFLYFHLPLAIMSFSFCAIAISFWYGGVGPGILALVIAVLIRTFYFQPEVDWISRLTYNLVFVLFAFFMLKATRAKNELEWRVARRTAALSKANEDLKLEIVERERAEQALQENVTALKKAFEMAQFLGAILRARPLRWGEPHSRGCSNPAMRCAMGSRSMRIGRSCVFVGLGHN